MKLIIDIPEKIVTAIQNGEDYRYDLHTTIAQGIPYEPNGDLISREALKQMLPAPIEDEYKRVHQIIDNIPSVPDRSKGEWIEKEETPASVSYYCSVCKTEGIPITPFCPWCGAKMKGGAE